MNYSEVKIFIKRCIDDVPAADKPVAESAYALWRKYHEDGEHASTRQVRHILNEMKHHGLTFAPWNTIYHDLETSIK